MRERFGAKNPQSWMCRFFAGCGGSSLMPEEPLNNIIRVTLEALATVLGGAQAIHTCSYDEPYSLPTEESVRIALRTQQIIAYETDVTYTVDPLGGSYYIETLTDRIEAEVEEEIQKIQEMGGAIRAIENGYMLKEIQKRAYEIEKKISSGEIVLVGRNKFASREKIQEKMRFYKMDPEVLATQRKNLQTVKGQRDSSAVRKALDQLEETARSSDNIMPPMIEAVKAYCTLGEVTQSLKNVFGKHREFTSIG
jgi:methylmalonyl-CoA mutase N-terminal domain/subunit